jgi:hypothetical protein
MDRCAARLVPDVAAEASALEQSFTLLTWPTGGQASESGAPSLVCSAVALRAMWGYASAKDLARLAWVSREGLDAAGLE